MTRRPSTAVRVLTALAAAALVAGCSSSSGDEGAKTSGSLDMSSIEEGYLGTDPGGEPQEGGTLRFGAFAEPRSLDPAVTIAALTTGGMEMLNIYDSLMRWDVEAEDWVPQLAESLEPDADHRVWTLRLRDGVEFSNGEVLDADAVKWSQERYASLPAPEAALWNAHVTDIETPDDRTVVYTLKDTWTMFPGILSTGPGMIVAEEAVGPGDDFTPIGAGPFVFQERLSGEALVLAANENYWAGRPHLDELRMSFMPSAQTALETLQSGGLDATFVRDPDQVEEVLAGDPRGYVNMTAAQNSALINAAEGRPGSDVRVRKAIQLALDPEAMAERAFGTTAGAGSTIFPEYSRWHTETEGLPHDPEQARALLEEAKADGYDGKIHYIDSSDPASKALALAFKALLESVGFEVEIDLQRSVADLISAVIVERDYDVSAWGHSFREADPVAKMFATLHSTGTQTYGSSTSPEMDALLEEFQVAPTLEQQRDVMDRIQQHVNEQVPFLVMGPYAETIVWTDEVHGAIGAASSMVMWHEAWIE